MSRGAFKYFLRNLQVLFMRINADFITVTVLTNDKRCLINNPCVEKPWGFKRIIKLISNKCAHINSMCAHLFENIRKQ